MKAKYRKYTSEYMSYLTTYHRRKWFSEGLRVGLCFGYWNRYKSK